MCAQGDDSTRSTMVSSRARLRSWRRSSCLLVRHAPSAATTEPLQCRVVLVVRLRRDPKGAFKTRAVVAQLMLVVLSLILSQIPEASIPPATGPSCELLDPLREYPNSAILRAIALSAALSADRRSQLAQDPHPGVGREVAKNPETPVEFLTLPHEDPHPGLRAAAVVGLTL